MKPRTIPVPRGVTLIELLIALAVVALLSAIAVPGYGAVMQRVNRNDARLALLRLQHLQERHFASHLRYASRFGAAGDADTLAHSGRSEAGHYLLQLSTPTDGQSFTATATADQDGRQAQDVACRSLSVDQIGTRRSADSGGGWHEDDPQRCWG